jgi:glycosyltransferase involved in cell wall biosynthesis
MISWNEAKTIDLSLKSLKGFVDEVIIADNGSFDGTQEIAREQLEKLKLEGKVIDVKATTLGKGRLASIKECRGNWILLIDSNLVLSNALKRELRKVQKSAVNVGCIKSLNLMGDYEHYFTPLPFHAHHISFFNRNSVRWRDARDRPVLKKQSKRISIQPWAVNLSRVRPAWRIWYRGEAFDPRFYKPKTRHAWRTETNRQDKWITAERYSSIVEYVKTEERKTLQDVKKIAPEWYLNQLNLYSKPLKSEFMKEIPEVIKTEQNNPRYKLIYEDNKIVGRRPEL